LAPRELLIALTWWAAKHRVFDYCLVARWEEVMRCAREDGVVLPPFHVDAVALEEALLLRRKEPYSSSSAPTIPQTTR